MEGWELEGSVGGVKISLWPPDPGRYPDSFDIEYCHEGRLWLWLFTKGHSADISHSLKWFTAEPAIRAVVDPHCFFHKGKALQRLYLFLQFFGSTLCQAREVSRLFSYLERYRIVGRTSGGGILHKYLNRFWYFIMTMAGDDISADMQYGCVMSLAPHHQTRTITQTVPPFRTCHLLFIRQVCHLENGPGSPMA